MTIRNQRFSLLKQPISSTLNQHLVDYPTPSNLSYWWGFGPLAGTMILSVLSSPALVSGLMVARAKNLASYYKAPGNKMPTPSFFDFSLSAFAGSYQIDPDYHDQRRGDSYFSSAPGVQETHRHASGSSTNLHLNLNDQSQDPIFLEIPLVGKALDCALLKVPIAGARILAFAAEVLGLKSYDVLTDLFPPRLE
ncbi:unnamed protein product [Arabidopsis thaliana]|uniref:Transmembrane protein n=1 Tax=Arabidopsis thaliana TaxID=3702 RepID=A0A654GGA0_ARATH|nr:unnamed protein product [Arabidopsis thaliana]VYS71805.1 unnamed protein product [Arabidopsis thaliana]